MSTLVTGANGHLGANLVRVLLERGEAVRVLVRPGGTQEGVRGLPLDVREGDVTDPAAVAAAMAGATRVYHLAGLVSLREVDRERLFRVNVEGTRIVMDAARRAEVERVVHCSSFGTIGHNPAGKSDESFVTSPFSRAMAYDQSKVAAEQEVARAVEAGLDVRIVNPTGVVGPWDFRPSLMGRTILDFARGRLPAYLPGAYDFIDARDAALGHVLAMERGRGGERYILSGEEVPVESMMRWLAEITGRRAPRLRIPVRLLEPVAMVKDVVERRLFPEHHPSFSVHSIRLLRSGKRAETRKAREELGLSTGPVREAFAAAVEWFRESGRL